MAPCLGSPPGGTTPDMATEKQKAAARRNLEKARAAQTAKRQGRPTSPPSPGQPAGQSAGLSTHRQNELPDSAFAFPGERKEPLIDASHVRNAVARFDQVEGVTDTERDQAWERIRAAARHYDVQVSADDWHQLVEDGAVRKAGG